MSLIIIASYSQTASVTLFQSISFPLPPKKEKKVSSNKLKKKKNLSTIKHRWRYFSAEASHLTVIARPTGHMFLRLDVIHSAQGFNPGLWHNRAHNFTFHRDKRVPVIWDLLIRSQLQFAGKWVGMIQGCKAGQKGHLQLSSYIAARQTYCA